MKRGEFDIAAPLVEQMDKLEHTIFELQGIINKKSYSIIAFDEGEDPIVVKLHPNEIASEVFIQDVLEYYINTLNLELDDLRKSFEEI